MSRNKTMKNYEDLEFSDDFMFGKVMEDQELCKEVLECLLQRPIEKLKSLETQKGFQFTADGKPMRLDVYNEDSDGGIYDVEMQNQNHKKIQDLQLPKRSRFYQSAIDIDFMNKGNSYKILPESSILFLCTFDPYQKGISQYTFKQRCNEMPELEMGDETVKIFYNCTYAGVDIPENLRDLYDYVESGEVRNELTRKIEDAVAKGRKNEIWRSQYIVTLLHFWCFPPDLVDFTFLLNNFTLSF